MSDFPGSAPDAFPGGPEDGAPLSAGDPPSMVNPLTVTLDGSSGSSDFELVQNDQLPSLFAVLEDANGPVDLTNATGINIEVVSKSDPSIEFESACSVVDAVAARVRYDWADTDTSVVGSYWMRFEVTWIGPKKSHHPNGDTPLTFTISEEAV